MDGGNQVGNGEGNLMEMKAKIVEAATHLLEAKGRGASVEDMAKAAGISVPVTYQFVKKPADIMLLIMENLQHEFLDGLGREMEEGLTPEHKLAVAVRQYYRVVDDQAAKVVLVYRGSRTLDKNGRGRIMDLERQAVEVFKGIMDQGVAAGAFRAGLDTDLAAYNLVMMGHLWALKSWHFKKRNMALEDFIVTQIENITAMLTA